MVEKKWLLIVHAEHMNAYESQQWHCFTESKWIWVLYSKLCSVTVECTNYCNEQLNFFVSTDQVPYPDENEVSLFVEKWSSIF